MKKFLNECGDCGFSYLNTVVNKGEKSLWCVVLSDRVKPQGRPSKCPLNPTERPGHCKCGYVKTCCGVLMTRATYQMLNER